MAVQTINYDDKQFLNQNSDIADVNKCNDTDLNEIKSVVNNNANEIILMKPIQLYYNQTGSNSSITLSDSVENYEYIEIYYRHQDNVNYKNSVKIKKPNETYTNLLYCLTSGAGNTLYINSKNIYIEGDTISVQNNIRYSLATISSSVSHSNTNTLFITEVLGYK